MLGIAIVLGLAEGLIKAIPQLVCKIPQIITSIVTGLLQGLGQMSEVGLNLVKGIWNGISNATAWILDKIKGFGQSVLNGIKSFFGIKSPSTLFKDEVGKNLALGVGEGFADTMDDVIADMQEALPTSFDVNPNINSSLVNSLPSQNTGWFEDLISKLERIYTAPSVNIYTNDLNQEKLDLIFRDVDRRFGLAYAK